METRKPRLPQGVVEKLSDNTGGGRHTKKKGKGSYQRREKHSKRDTRENNQISFPSLFESTSSSTFKQGNSLKYIIFLWMRAHGILHLTRVAG